MFILPGQNPVCCFCILLSMAISDELVSYFRVWTTTIHHADLWLRPNDKNLKLLWFILGFCHAICHYWW